MREISFQAQWDASNQHLQHNDAGLAGILLSPLKTLCRYILLPASTYSQSAVAEIDRLWHERWEGNPFANPQIPAAESLFLRAHYEPIVLKLTTPDGIPIIGTLYRHRRSAHLDIPTVLCCPPNGGISRGNGWDWLLIKGGRSSQPFNVVVFDYRTCATSGGTIDALKEILIDGETVYQAARDGLPISEPNLRLLGFSMGGSVSATLADIHPLSGRCVSLKSFDSLDNAIQHSRLTELLPAYLRSFGRWICSAFSQIVSWAGWEMNVRATLERIKQRTLFVYHPNDLIVPETAAAVQAVSLTPLQAATQVVKLQFKPIIRSVPSTFNHHTAPLSYYQDANGQNASKRIVNFLLGRNMR